MGDLDLLAESGLELLACLSALAIVFSRACCLLSSSLAAALEGRWAAKGLLLSPSLFSLWVSAEACRPRLAATMQVLDVYHEAF